MPTFQNEKEGSRPGSRLEGPNQRLGSWGEGDESPPHQLGGLGERCKLPQQGPARSRGHHTVFAIFEVFRRLVLLYYWQ